MNRMDLIQSISRYLSRLSENVKLLNAIGDLSINKYAESALIKVFDILIAPGFKNVNTTDQKNNPSIDLINPVKKVGIQITSNSKLEKIKDCINKFYSRQVYNDVDLLFVYVLTEKQRKYDQSKIDHYISQCRKVHGIEKTLGFDSINCIWDKVTVLKKIDGELDLQKMGQIEIHLRSEFEKIEIHDKLQSYYNEIRNKYFEIVLNDSQGMTLRDIYVEPKFSVYESSLNVGKAVNSSPGFKTIKNIEFIHNYFSNYFFKSAQPSGVISASIVLILGYPGQGKTSFCRRLLNDYLSEKLNKSKDIFYFRLKDIRQAKNLIGNPLATLHEEALFMTETSIDKFDFRKSVLVLDGLDELYMKEDLKLDDIERLCKELIRESEKFSSLQIIITSRYGYVDLEKLKNESVLILKINRFEQQQQESWLDKYLRFHPDIWLTRAKLRQYNSKRRNSGTSHIKELLEQPLLLHIVASLSADIENATNRTRIYDQLFTELIERRYSSSGQIEIMKNIGRKDLRELIQEIAFAIYQTGNGYISRKDLLEQPAVQKYLDRFPNKDFKESIKGIMISFYFKESIRNSENETDDKNFVIEFLHKSLEEYMVAENVTRTLMWNFRNKDLNGDYILNNSFDVLKLLNNLFCQQPLSREIQEFIGLLLDGENPSFKLEVSERMAYFFDALALHDFLFKFDSRTSKNPVSRIVYCFNATWLVLKNLDPKRNYLGNSKIRQNVANLFKLLMNSYPYLSYDNYDYQSLSDIELHSCLAIGRKSLYSVDFSNSELWNSQFIGTQMVNCMFVQADLYNVGIYSCEIKKSSFHNANCSSWILENVTINNVDFSGAYISEWKMRKVRFVNMQVSHFYGAEFDLETLLELIMLDVKIDLKKLRIVRSEGRKQPIEYDELVKIIQEMHSSTKIKKNSLLK